MTERTLKKFDHNFINNGDSYELSAYSSLYSEDLLNKIFSRLQITDTTAKKEMKEAILYAAMYFEVAKKNYLNAYIAENETRSTLKRFYNSIKKSNAIFNEICNQPTNKNQFLLNAKNLTDQGLGLEKLHEIFASLENASEEAFSGHIYKNFADNEGAVLHAWLDNLYPAWATHSKIPMQEGKYHEDIGYNSESYLALCDLMKPLDRKVPKASIATAIKTINKKFKQAKTE